MNASAQSTRSRTRCYSTINQAVPSPDRMFLFYEVLPIPVRNGVKWHPGCQIWKQRTMLTSLFDNSLANKPASLQLSSSMTDKHRASPWRTLSTGFNSRGIGEGKCNLPPSVHRVLEPAVYCQNMVIFCSHFTTRFNEISPKTKTSTANLCFIEML